jgi:sodium-dependent dicarboxylate transporter 2/3/5
LSPGQKNVWFAFGVTVALWIIPGLVGIIGGTDSRVFLWLNGHLPESTVALIGGLLLFVLPVNWRERQFTLNWGQASRIDWGTILLFGGGLALGELMFSTGLASWLGEGLAHTFHAHTNFGVIALFTFVAILISEATSNTASATMVVPVAIAVAQAAGTNPVQAALAATLGASMGFMLPVSTPPNAIVYGSGCVPIRKMVRSGIILDLVGFGVIVGVVAFLVPHCVPLR